MFYEEIIKEMLDNNMSIRDLAKKYNISKSKLHRELTKAKVNLDNDTLVKFNNLLESNKKKGKKKEIGISNGKCESKKRKS